MTRARVTNLRLVPARLRDRARGLLAFVAFQVNGLRVDGATVRRTRRGRLVLSYPCRRDCRGRERAYVLPVDARVRWEVQAAVLAEFAREANGTEQSLITALTVVSSAIEAHVEARK